MPEQIVTDLLLNLEPYEAQINKAVEGMERYDTATVSATKDTKTFENSLGSASGKLNATKIAAEGAAAAEQNMAAAMVDVTKSTTATVAATDKLTAADQKQAQAVQGVTTEQQELSAQRTKDNQSFQGQSQAQVGALQKIKAEIAALNAKKLTLTDPKQIAAANTQLSKLTKEFNTLNTTSVKTGGGIKSALGSISQQVSTAIPQVGGLGGSFLGLLGPIGLAVGAAAGIGSAFINNMDAGQVFFDGLSRTAGIVFDKLTGKFIEVKNSITDVYDNLSSGESVFGRVFGTYVEAITIPLQLTKRLVGFIGDITGISAAIEDAAQEGFQLAQAYDDIDEAQTKNIVTNAELDKQVGELNVKLRNRTTSEAERLKIGEQIGKLETERAANELKVLKDITAARQREVDNELKSGKGVSDEKARALAEAKAAEINASAQSIELLERTQNRTDQIRQQGDAKRKAAADKAAAEEKKIADARLALEEELNKASIALLDERSKAEAEALNTRDARVEKAAGDAALLVQIEEQYQADVQAIRDKAAQDAEDIANKQAQALQNAQLGSAQNRLQQLQAEQEIALQLAIQNGEDVQQLVLDQLQEQSELQQEVADIRLAQLTDQYNADFAALDGNLIAQLDRLEQFNLDKQALQQEANDKEIQAKQQLLELNAELDSAEAALGQSRIDAAAAAGSVISQLAGDSAEAAKAGLVVQKAAAVAQVISTTSAATAAAQAAAAAIPPILAPGVPNPAFPVAQAISIAQIARLRISAGINIAQIIAQVIGGFDKGGHVSDSKGGRIKASHGIPITKPGGDNRLVTAKVDELFINAVQERKAEAIHPGIFAEIGVSGFPKGTHINRDDHSIYAPNDSYLTNRYEVSNMAAPNLTTHTKWISSAAEVNSYVEGRTTNITYNSTSTTSSTFSDKKLVGATNLVHKEAKKQTEILAALYAGASKRPNKRLH